MLYFPDENQNLLTQKKFGTTFWSSAIKNRKNIHLTNEIDPTYGSGLYSVEVVDENGCVGYYDYDFLSTNFDSVENNEIVLYPNPSSGILNFNKPLDNERIEIFSFKGIRVFDKIVASSNSINLNLDSGIYLMKISNNYRSLNTKLIIK